MRASKQTAGHRTSRRWGIYLLSAAIGIGIFSWNIPAASAYLCGTNGNYHVGWNTQNYTHGQGDTFEGISAPLTDRSGYVLCSSDHTFNNFSTAWDMVETNAAKNPKGGGYSQSGTLYWYGASCVMLWGEMAPYPNDPGDFKDYYVPNACSSPGTVVTYSNYTVWNSSVGDWRMVAVAGLYVLHESVWSPITNWDTPFDVETTAEASYTENNVPGSTASPYEYASIQVQRYADDSWEDACGKANLAKTNENPSRWSAGATACDHTQTWTPSN